MIFMTFSHSLLQHKELTYSVSRYKLYINIKHLFAVNLLSVNFLK